MTTKETQKDLPKTTLRSDRELEVQFSGANGGLRKRAKENGGLTGIRTQDQRLKRPLLYQLSYQPLKKCPNIVPIFLCLTR